MVRLLFPYHLPPVCHTELGTLMGQNWEEDSKTKKIWALNEEQGGPRSCITVEASKSYVPEILGKGEEFK